MLTLNRFHTLLWCFYRYFKQVNAAIWLREFTFNDYLPLKKLDGSTICQVMKKVENAVKNNFNYVVLMDIRNDSLKAVDMLYFLPTFFPFLSKDGCNQEHNYSELYATLCAIWYHSHNLKNVKNIHGGVLLLEHSSMSAF